MRINVYLVLAGGNYKGKKLIHKTSVAFPTKYGIKHKMSIVYLKITSTMTYLKHKFSTNIYKRFHNVKKRKSNFSKGGLGWSTYPA